MQSNLRIVLVAPLYGGNIGSCCRAMSNMGLGDLAIVTPQETVNWKEAEIMAVHARAILESRKTCATLEEAVADCVAVVGTTALRGLYRQHCKSPREWAPDLAALSERGKVAIVFGREDKGLFNEEIALCTHLVQIPSDAAYTSLNLAQAVLILCYELFLVQGQYEPVHEKSDLAPNRMKEQLMKMWRAYLLDIGFMSDETADHMMAGLQRIFSRGVLTTDDTQIMMGVTRQGTWAFRNGGTPSSDKL